MKTLHQLFLALLMLSPVVAAKADVAETIAKARAYLGTEQALAAVHTVQFVGTLETMEITPEGARPLRATLEIIFHKPFRQRITVNFSSRIEVTALDDYEGWQRIEDTADPTRWRLSLLGKDQIRRLRANTWENLAFFRGLEDRGGRVDDLGVVNVGDTQARKLAFVHAPDIIFYRYFELETGRLVLTETEKGGSIREEGEIIVEGVRFPHKIITVNKLEDGSEREVTVGFDRIVVNGEVSRSLFAVPAVGAR